MAKLRCPTCDTSVSVKDEKIGSSVYCDACGEKFVAKGATSRRELEDDEDRPIRSSRRRDDDDDDYDDEPRPKKKKKFKPKSRSNTGTVAFVFAGAIFLGLIATVGGLAFYFAAKKRPVPMAIAPANNGAPMAPMAPIGPNPNGFGALPAGGNVPPQPQPNLPQAPMGVPGNPQPGAAGQLKATLSNPRWGNRGLQSFEVDYNFSNGRPIGGRFQIKFKSPDGQTGSANMIGLIQQQGTITIQILGIGGRVQGPLEIWMEEGGFPGAFGRDGTVVSNRVTLN